MKELEVHPESTDQKKRRRRQTDNKVRATAHLPPYSSLQLDVVARNTYFDSNGSNVINVTTPEGGNYYFYMEFCYQKLISWLY
jgi:hypothetical protein